MDSVSLYGTCTVLNSLLASLVTLPSKYFAVSFHISASVTGFGSGVFTKPLSTVSVSITGAGEERKNFPWKAVFF